MKEFFKASNDDGSDDVGDDFVEQAEQTLEYNPEVEGFDDESGIDDCINEIADDLDYDEEFDDDDFDNDNFDDLDDDDHDLNECFNVPESDCEQLSNEDSNEFLRDEEILDFESEGENEEIDVDFEQEFESEDADILDEDHDEWDEKDAGELENSQSHSILNEKEIQEIRNNVRLEIENERQVQDNFSRNVFGLDPEKNRFFGSYGINYDNYIGENIVREQGNSYPDMQGTCGLSSLTNALNYLGEDVNEKDVIDAATSRDLCQHHTRNIKDNGGTEIWQIEELARDFGYEAEHTHPATLSSIEETLLNGKSIMLTVSGEHLDRKEPMGELLSANLPYTDHWVSVLGVQTDEITGETTGVWVQDTGGFSPQTDGKIFISKERLEQITENYRDCDILSFKKENYND